MHEKGRGVVVPVHVLTKENPDDKILAQLNQEQMKHKKGQKMYSTSHSKVRMKDIHSIIWSV